jgi:hypothetical protein
MDEEGGTSNQVRGFVAEESFIDETWPLASSGRLGTTQFAVKLIHKS